MLLKKGLIHLTGYGGLTFLLIGTLFTCAKNGDKKNAETSTLSEVLEKSASDNFVDAVPVTIEIVSTRSVSDYVGAVGTVAAYFDVMVVSETSGQVVKVLAEVGDRVSKGDILVVVDNELQSLNVESAKAQFILAEANYEKATRDLMRSESLFESEDISKYELEGAQIQKKSAEAQYLAAKAALGVAERQLADTRIKSPIDGRVAFREVDLGATLSPGMPVASVVFIDNVKVNISVSEKEVAKIKVGMIAKVYAESFPNKKFRGKVFSVALKADMATRTFPVQVVLPNKGAEKLLPGMIARIEIETNRGKAITVPQDAILKLYGKNVAFIVDGDSVNERQITIGNNIGDRVIIESGLEKGDTLIVKGQENVSKGKKVRIIYE